MEKIRIRDKHPGSTTLKNVVMSLRVFCGVCCVEERCDGGRNILHALVSQCQPTSNKDSDQDAIQTSGDNLVWDTCTKYVYI